MWLLLLSWKQRCWCLSVLTLAYMVPSMAVDRTKFRTCHQTSFCRRHRDGHSARLYEYELVPESLEFHHPAAGGGVAVPQHETSGGGGGGSDTTSTTNKGPGNSVWSHLSRRLLGSSQQQGMMNSKHQGSKEDVHFRGTRPTVTGLIRNTAKETSTGQLEQLQFALYAMEQGMVRMRVTELYGTPNKAYETPRVTYDELVLDKAAAAWTEASHVKWISNNNNNNNNEQDQVLLKRLIQFSQQQQQEDLVSNYSVLQVGDTEEDSTSVLLRLQPFAVYFFRSNSVEAGPILVLNAQSMMSFEIRRYKDDKEPVVVTTAEKAAATTPLEEQQQEKEDADADAATTNKKEIVGYWEDGLAIYSDGTREEKKSGEDEQEEQGRKLSEDELHELDRKGLWEETFGSHVDSKPFGPMSVGMDMTFPNSLHLYGLPEHASSAVLQTTFAAGEEEEHNSAHYKEPYRLYNLDVFDYELDETMALYGAVPLVVSQSTTTGTTGVFWFNPTETFVDVLQQQQQTTTTTHWMSESGIVDLFILPGPNPSHVYRQYAKLTGTAPVPPIFSLGYHQCRWNYKDEKDVYYVHGKFEELDYPYDVLWLDIEHTDGKRYFTWDDKLFPHPAEMQNKLWATGRRMVTIIDPHIKRDDKYAIHSQATAKGLYIKDKDGKKDYDGWCWPGSSSYLDFTQEHVRKWWADLFAYQKYKGSTSSLFTWNDMNEPSVFNGPEVSMQKDLRNLQGEEHREWHNLYGMLFHRATSEGLLTRNPEPRARPFVLSRAFFAGSQRYGAIWTGDNAAEWSHLQITAPMLLSLNVAALSFVGADVGGFFGNPDAELFTRWMQAGAYQPFFRGHGHHDSKRKEPWMFDEDTLARCRRAAMARYALLPMWYTLFHVAETTGMPVMRMMWMQYPQLEALYTVDDQYMIGSDLLVHPVVDPGITEVEVWFPSQDVWYHADTLQRVDMADNGNGQDDGVLSKSCPADMDTIPVYQRGGSILTRKLRLRRSSQMMKSDPYTLFVALDQKSQAAGTLYMDDEETFLYQTKSDYAVAYFAIQSLDDNKGAATKKSIMTNQVLQGAGWSGRVDARMIERIVVAGMTIQPKSITLLSSTENNNNNNVSIDFEYDAKAQILVLRKPSVSAVQNWTIEFQY